MSDSGDEVSDLAVAAGRGDRDAAAALIRATQRDVWRFLLYLVGHADAEDLTRETFIRALRDVHRFRAHGSGRTWLLAIARRVAADHSRTAARSRSAPDQDWTHAGPGQDETVAINGAVRDLPHDRRDAYVLTQVLGLDYAAAAEVCDCPAGTIRARVASARHDLVAVLAEVVRPTTGHAQRR
jgi:RNA polymerase sigma-70 factor, ECF subfamily